ncbi:MAG: hypothetical protein IPG28_16875 [Betaproteobacteria bacterium]|jgi:uncharacterized membrane protein YccC|nr:hypothetical protein [Betaproteobacteria bacterium]MBK6603173.1 hypothetical protein [Betaproteobacteria bacterium]MBK7080223.1 hypothetical protein [Betaproteobacteria bacterium]MBK7591129.1 hypothetical protein [Betaproteobacteria bacterium]MBK7744839.1 hypothetical protein [Betaproteobacteria bacterium]
MHVAPPSAVESAPAAGESASFELRPRHPALRRALGLAVALAVLYAVWHGYRNPDFLLDLAAFRLC